MPGNGMPVSVVAISAPSQSPTNLLHGLSTHGLGAGSIPTSPLPLRLLLRPPCVDLVKDASNTATRSKVFILLLIYS